MNEDGSWHTSRQDLPANEGLRIINVRSPEGTKWQDIEMTGYVRLISYSSLERFSWRVTSGNPHTETYERAGYYVSLRYDGSTADFSKELWHGSGGAGYAVPKGMVSDVTDPVQNRWVGIKMIVYNMNNDR
jgi:hypothetical protein